ncbi:hypothetical protein NQ318_006820 [Aromia moschata]|uniref:Uncharacterized protein n=1 Tax=Aromia moschata TaxID=1265417 RepID=A0AAV8XRU5_9CUCU|nr:hypothetical protein NQ318_006820 [Aromia moschata]
MLHIASGAYLPHGRQNLYNHLSKTGYFPPKSNHGTPKAIIVDEDGILIRILENPGVSTRRLSATTELR